MICTAKQQRKLFLPPIRIYALINVEEETTSYLEGVGVDSDAMINVYFHKKRLNDDQNVFVRQGDFVLYGEVYYEIVKLSSPRKLFGQVDHTFETMAVFKRARRGLFDAT